MSGNASNKRNLHSDATGGPVKRIKLTAGGSASVAPVANVQSSPSVDVPAPTTASDNAASSKSSRSKGKEKAAEMTEIPELDNGPGPPNKQRIRKLAPPRPFPTVPTSVAATGPRSAHSEGKNVICITRKTPIGMYLRRCKDVILKDGYKTLHLSAMGAAIPQLLQLSASLPAILPHPPEEIHTEVLTGTVQVQDELIPEDDEDDLSYRTRDKSSLMIIIKIGDGVDEVLRLGKGKKGQKKEAGSSSRHGGKKKGHDIGGRKGCAPSNQIVVREEDLEEG